MKTYFERYANPITLFNDPPANSLKISIVIPCYNEPDIISSLVSLNNCKPVVGVEVIVIVNEEETCNDEVKQQNRITLAQIETWKNKTSLNYSLLTYHLIASARDAGVGFARKVGMDEAARRFERANCDNGVICCFDADSTCAANYIESVSRHFPINSPKPNGATVYYEHSLPDDNSLKEGIIQYELHLRYYVNALRLIGYPYAHQTVGSSMIVRSGIYQKIGGMNKRKAGEDFYFLHRVMPTGNFIDIKDTVIYPSARISDRVPFGTGKAMHKWQQENSTDYLTYNLLSFQDLKNLFIKSESFFELKLNEVEEQVNKLPVSIRSYLKNNEFDKALMRINSHSKNRATFINKWYQYFDGFRVLKYLHYARDNYYENKPVLGQAAALAQLRWPTETTKYVTAADWLSFYQHKDKEA